MQTVLDALVEVPALAPLDVIAAPLARALYSVLYIDARKAPNLARFTFLAPRLASSGATGTKPPTISPPTCARPTLPYTRTLTDLIGELYTRSDTFRQLWARHDVRAYDRGIKRFQHPVAGTPDLRHDLLQPATEPALTMITYTAAP
ncbi:hypothetical protein ACFXDF_18990 [Streptomyces sp. NPDC059426]|uniref:MmyB family transcriptional regulator n=1 Tax=Streptomyces sp. NPDC059426 TaxID=3346827 RepID=UPI0036AD258F